MVTETAAAAALCQHLFLKELQFPSWESWGHWKGGQGAGTDLFVEPLSLSLRGATIPTSLGAAGMVFASQTRPSQGLSPPPLSRARWESALELSPEHWNNTGITGLALHHLHPHRAHLAVQMPS